MNDPLAERALAIVETRLGGIVHWERYNTDAGLRVYRARRTLQECELPCVVLWDDGETAESADGHSASMRTTLQFSVEGHICANQCDTGRQLGLLRADIKRALLVGRGAVADDAGAIGVLTYAGAESQARNDGAASEAVSLRFSINYQEAYGDPTKSR